MTPLLMGNHHMHFVFSFCAGGRKKYKDQRHYERQLCYKACGFLVSDLGELALFFLFLYGLYIRFMLPQSKWLFKMLLYLKSNY